MIDVVEQVIERHPEVKNEGIPEIKHTHLQILWLLTSGRPAKVSLKTELVHHRNYQTRDEARHDIFDFVEVFYWSF